MDEPGNEPDRGEPKTEVEAVDDVGFARTLLQLFIIPAFVVAVAVSLFFFSAWLISDEKTGVDYLHEIRSGSSNRRWQAAFELSKLITMGKDARRMEGLVPEMMELFESATDDDPRVRHYLALTLGHLEDPAAVPVLIDALSDRDATTRLYSAWALGNIGDPRAVTPLLDRVRDDDPGVRKMAIYGLGVLGDTRAIERLLPALQDPQPDVSMNAAIALAQLGDDTGEANLLQMLDREYMNQFGDMNAAQRAQAMESAIKAAALVGGAEIRESLRDLASEDPNLNLREAALEALRQLDDPGRDSSGSSEPRP